MAVAVAVSGEPENKMKMVIKGGPMASAVSPSLATQPTSIPNAAAVKASIVRTPRNFASLQRCEAGARGGGGGARRPTGVRRGGKISRKQLVHVPSLGCVLQRQETSS